ncbi:hypothetical protein [Chryseobacterium aureum]|uniref:hypothetical protein n=1 Tax=Chryseobacterium aureum TaxID=2497456 RepID=UPI000F888E8D|nr:hypothetical protein [Chryseobacterium aureum]
MDGEKIIKTLRHKDFVKVAHTGTCFEDGAAIYAKEIKENIFLLFEENTSRLASGSKRKSLKNGGFFITL